MERKRREGKQAGPALNPLKGILRLPSLYGELGSTPSAKAKLLKLQGIHRGRAGKKELASGKNFAAGKTTALNA
jgi:hypothetical protein